MSKTILTEGDEGVLLIVKDVKPMHVKKPDGRWPVHVLYGGAHLFKADMAPKLGRIAMKNFKAYAPNFVEFANAMRLSGAEYLPTYPDAVKKLEKQLSNGPEKVKAENFPAWFAWTVYQRTIEKLQTEPIEDFRIDFEDGYGFRPDDEEDAHAVSASDELAKAFLNGSITPFCGFRIKSMALETWGRAVRTLQLFLENLFTKTGGRMPENFVVTLPKVSVKKEVRELCKALQQIEKKTGLKKGSIKIEIMVETPQSIIDRKGRPALLGLVKAAKGRCTSVHFGAYDYTASLGISSTHQRLDHPACDFARQMMLLTLTPQGIRLSDSVTTEIPVEKHRGEKLTKFQLLENKASIHSAWRRHFENVARSMADGFYQSWDLHPNQLVARHAAVCAFFLNEYAQQAERLKGFIDKATQATLTGNAFDDAATAQGLMNFFKRGIDCGALTQDEVSDITGLTKDELAENSFQKILEHRQFNRAS